MQAGKSLDKALIYLGGEETPLSQLPEKDVRARLDTLRSAQFRTQAVEAVAMPLKRLSSLLLGQPEPVEPEVSINNQWSELYTVIEVSGLDRPGLLYELTTAISKLNLNIASAHVATFGERARRVLRHRPAGRADQRADAAGSDQERAAASARQRRHGGSAGGLKASSRSDAAAVRDGTN